MNSRRDGAGRPGRRHASHLRFESRPIVQARHLLSAATIALAFCAAGAFAADGCRTIANGVQKCDVQTGQERSRDDVVADMHAAAATPGTGCRTVANGVQKCDVPTGQELTREAVVAGMRDTRVSAYTGCRTIANGVQKCDLPSNVERARDTAVAGVR